MVGVDSVADFLDSLEARRRLGRFVTVAGASGAVVPLLVLVGWALGNQDIPSFASGHDQMVPWTATGCLTGAIWTLGWRGLDRHPALRPVLALGAVLVLAIGMVAIIENLAHVGLGLDTLLWPSSTKAAAAQYPGRPSLQTAIALAVLGAAQLAMVADRRPCQPDVAGLAAWAVTALGALGLAGRALQISATFTSAQLGSGGLSVFTGAALLLTGSAVVAISAGPALLALSSRSVAARRELRIMLPAAIVIPVAVFLAAYVSLELSGAAQVVGPLIASAAVVVLASVLRFVNLGVFRDIAEHMEVEQHLTGQIALYAAAVQSSNDAISTKNLDGTITAWNPAAERMYGYSANEVIGRDGELIVPDGYREELRSILRQVRDGGHARSIETVRQRRDGTRLDVSLTVSPVLDAAGTVVGASSIARDVTERRREQALIVQRGEELERSRQETLNLLARASEYRDDDTYQHTLRIGHTAALLAAACGLGDRLADIIRQAAPLHDLGKVAVPDSILLKPGKLTDEEFAIMRTHSVVGARILAGSESDILQAAEQIALTHHERWDGRGYPNGLRGEDIPIFGRIVAVADVFDALTHERPYKAAWPIDRATAEIAAGAGSQFDPSIVTAFAALDHQRLI
jgi:PAS domain S-box-containing protein